MRYLLLLICGLLMTELVAQNQKPDKILKKDNTQIEARVIEITETQVKYRRFSNLEGPIYSIGKSELAVVMYANGETEIFGSQPAAANPAPEPKQYATVETPSAVQPSAASTTSTESESFKGLIFYYEMGYTRFGDYGNNIGGMFLGGALGYRFSRAFSMEGQLGYGTYFPDTPDGQIGITELNSVYLLPKATVRIYFSKESHTALYLSGGVGYAGSYGEFQDYTKKGSPTYKLDGYDGVAYEIGGGLLFRKFAVGTDYLSSKNFSMVKLGIKFGL